MNTFDLSLLKINIQAYMENGTTKAQSLEAKIKTTSLSIYGDDFRNQDTESKICNAV